MAKRSPRPLNPDPRSLAWALLCGILSMVLIGWAASRAWPMFLDIGTQDMRFVSGFHEPEQMDGMRFRWTSRQSVLSLPRPSAGSAILQMRLINGYPEQIPTPRVRVSADRHVLAEMQVAGWRQGQRDYHILVPVDPSLNWFIPISLESSVYQPPGDPRPLGAMLDYVQLKPARNATPLPPLHTLSYACMLGVLVFAACVLMGLRHVVAAGWTLAVVGLIALAVLIHPLDTLPFLQLLAAIPAIACVGLWLIHSLLPIHYSQAPSAPVAPEHQLQQRQHSRLAFTHVRAFRFVRQDKPGFSIPSFSISGEQLPIMLAIAWWMLPIFQLVQVWDGAAIGVGVETLVLGLIAAAILIIAILVAYLRGGMWPLRQRDALIMRYVLIALALGAAIHLSYAVWYAFTRSGKDFWILFKGARDWVQGGSFYDLEAIMTNHVGAVFKVPPFYGMLFAPFVFQDGLQILLYHRLVNVGLMMTTAFVWLRMFRVRPLWWGLSTIVILLNSRPLADTIAYGQIDLMLLFLLSCALWAMNRGQESGGRGQERGGHRDTGRSGAGEPRSRGDSRQQTADQESGVRDQGSGIRRLGQTGSRGAQEPGRQQIRDQGSGIRDQEPGSPEDGEPGRQQTADSRQQTRGQGSGIRAQETGADREPGRHQTPDSETERQGAWETRDQGSGVRDQGSGDRGRPADRETGPEEWEEPYQLAPPPPHPPATPLPPHLLTSSPPHISWGDLLAGALIALGTLFKIYPVILLAFFVLKRRWWGLVGFGLGMLLYNGLAVAIVGWEMHRIYVFELLPRIGGTTSWVENQTISGFLARLVDTPFEAHLLENRPLALLGTLLSGLLSLGACLLVLRPAASGSTRFALQYCQFLLLMVLAVPTAWMHYETLLVLVFGVVLLHVRERKIPLVHATMLALSFALISYGNQWSFNGTSMLGILTIAGVSYKFYGMLLLAGLMGRYVLEKDGE